MVVVMFVGIVDVRPVVIVYLKKLGGKVPLTEGVSFKERGRSKEKTNQQTLILLGKALKFLTAVCLAPNIIDPACFKSFDGDTVRFWQITS